MPHARQQIRSYLATTTLAGLATTGTNVTTSRPEEGRPFTSLPALSIHTPSEDEREEWRTETTNTRQVAVVVRGYAAASADVDDVLDTIAAEVETAIGADMTLGGLVLDVVYRATESSFNDEAETPHGFIELTFVGTYRTPYDDPQTITN